MEQVLLAALELHEDPQLLREAGIHTSSNAANGTCMKTRDTSDCIFAVTQWTLQVATCALNGSPFTETSGAEALAAAVGYKMLRKDTPGGVGRHLVKYGVAGYAFRTTQVTPASQLVEM